MAVCGAGPGSFPETVFQITMNPEPSEKEQP